MISISIIEDQSEVRENLVACLGDVPGFRCVGAHATGEEGLRAIPKENPDVVLMDINLPGMSGIQCVARLKKRMPNLQVLMLTMYDDGDRIFDSLRAGANGYLLKNIPQEEMVQAVQQVHAGGAPMSLQIARKVINHFHQTRPDSDLEQLSVRDWRFCGCWPKVTGTRKSPTSSPSALARSVTTSATFTTNCTFIRGSRRPTSWRTSRNTAAGAGFSAPPRAFRPAAGRYISTVLSTVWQPYQIPMVLRGGDLIIYLTTTRKFMHRNAFCQANTRAEAPLFSKPPANRTAHATHQPMKNQPYLRFLALGALLLCAAPPAARANDIKANTASMATNAVNWLTADPGNGGTGLVPAPTDTGEFDATISANNLANLSLGQTVIFGGLQFDTTVNGPAVITDSSTLAVGAAGLTINTNVTLNAPYRSGVVQTWTVAPNCTLNLNGTVLLDESTSSGNEDPFFPTTGNQVLTITGGGTVNVPNAVLEPNYTGSGTGISGTSGVLITGGTFSGLGITIERSVNSGTAYPSIGAPLPPPPRRASWSTARPRSSIWAPCTIGGGFANNPASANIWGCHHRHQRRDCGRHRRQQQPPALGRL